MQDSSHYKSDAFDLREIINYHYHYHIMAKKLEGSREVMSWMPFLKSLELSTFKSQTTKTLVMDHSFETQKFLQGAHQEQANIQWLPEFLVLKFLHSSFCSSFEAVAPDRSNMTEIEFEFDRKCITSTSLNN